MRALIYLRWRMLANGLVGLVTSPKRMASAVFVIVWIAVSLGFGLVSHTAQGSSPAAMAVPAAYARLVVLIIILMLTLMVVQRGLEGTVFSFSGADYDFLFPTPVSRRMVIVVRVLEDSLATLLWTGVVLSGLRVVLPVEIVDLARASSPWLQGLAAGLYAVFVINTARAIQLSLAGGETLLGAGGIVSKALWGVLLAMLGGAAYVLVQGARAQTVMHDLSEGPWAFILAPALAVAAVVTGEAPPVFGTDTVAVASLAALALIASVAACLLDRDIIEGTLEHSAHVAGVRAAARAQDMEQMAGVRLKGAGGRRSLSVSWRRPEWAPVYKYIAETLHQGWPQALRWAVLLSLPGLGARVFGLSGTAPALLAGPAIAYLLLLVSSFQALRFRSELNHAPLLRALPITPAWQLLSGLTPRALVLSAGFAIALGSFHLGYECPGVGAHAAVALCLPLACLLSCLMGALTACVFPSSEDAGQRLLAGVLHMAALGLALAPAMVAIALCAVARYPLAVTALLGNLGLLPGVVLSAWGTARMFANFEPGTE